jgi:alpha-tubulin suppressor-like RCC1 family protein
MRGQSLISVHKAAYLPRVLVRWVLVCGSCLIFSLACSSSSSDGTPHKSSGGGAAGRGKAEGGNSGPASGGSGNSTTPSGVAGGDHRAQDVSVGSDHICALLVDGSVLCWGSNNTGQLGASTRASSSTKPVVVSEISNGIALSAGLLHSCALRVGGQVQCWGSDKSSVSDVVEVSAGFNRTCVVVTGGELRCWGDNYHGALGDGTTTNSSEPVAVSGISNAVAVSTGYEHSCAVLADGTVACWGNNSNGELGNGSTAALADSLVPVPVTGINNAESISVGFGHSCVVLADKTLKCWGENNSGQLGDGTKTKQPVPVVVAGVTNAAKVSAGQDYTCALLSDGRIQCWGMNKYGQLGDGTTTDSLAPVEVAGGGMQATAISCDSGRSCAVDTNGAVKCWGHNNDGKLGDGTTTDRLTPVTVSGF